MGSDIIEFNDRGAKLKVWVGVDTATTAMLGLAIFFGISLALILYAKIK